MTVVAPARGPTGESEVNLKLSFFFRLRWPAQPVAESTLRQPREDTAGPTVV